ncbi:hypothetical protein HMPREF0454_01255 [Hafnia alvei ATCC 51873]|uniref:Uncharacterized protein n=1 Tax=Hafnia alvei ATCC 51873 TaxID=1002364 RepID=G9Y3X6_HAFAL|nr:hypothetical protein HMPREF0454_01255 [Hafnia alvei ATCC 51873]
MLIAPLVKFCHQTTLSVKNRQSEASLLMLKRDNTRHLNKAVLQTMPKWIFMD